MTMERDMGRLRNLPCTGHNGQLAAHNGKLAAHNGKLAAHNGQEDGGSEERMTGEIIVGPQGPWKKDLMGHRNKDLMAFITWRT